jgi:predicted naringenin-chalcone synthase
MNQFAGIWSIGTASPEYSIEQSDAVAFAQEIGITTRWLNALPALYRKSGVRKRGSVLLNAAAGAPSTRQTFYPNATPDRPFGPTTADRMSQYAEHAGPLAAKSAKIALERAQLQGAKISHLVTVSCTGFASPGIDHQIIQSLGLPPTVQRTHIGFMGCHGAINGLRTAKSIAESDPNAIVLVAAVELCSLHQQYTEDPQQLVANSLFADGAASVIVAARPPFTDTSMDNASSSDARCWKIVSSFSFYIPNTADTMSWKIGDYGFSMQLSPEVPQIIKEQLSAPTCQWLKNYGLDPFDHSSELAWVVHPGGPRILDAVAEAFKLDEHRIELSRKVLSEHGNMSSPTVLFILDQMPVRDMSAPYCIAIAFGPGLHAEALLLKNDHIAWAFEERIA